MKCRAYILLAVAAALWWVPTTNSGARAGDFEEMLGDTCDPGDLPQAQHKSWRIYCTGEERKAFDRMRSLASVVPTDIWRECAASIAKPKGSSIILFVNCLYKVLDGLPSLPRNSAVLSHSGFEQRFWTLKECWDAQKADGGVCVAH